MVRRADRVDLRTYSRDNRVVLQTKREDGPTPAGGTYTVTTWDDETGSAEIRETRRGRPSGASSGVGAIHHRCWGLGQSRWRTSKLRSFRSADQHASHPQLTFRRRSTPAGDVFRHSLSDESRCGGSGPAVGANWPNRNQSSSGSSENVAVFGDTKVGFERFAVGASALGVTGGVEQDEIASRGAERHLVISVGDDW